MISLILKVKMKSTFFLLFVYAFVITVVNCIPWWIVQISENLNIFNPVIVTDYLKINEKVELTKIFSNARHQISYNFSPKSLRLKYQSFIYLSANLENFPLQLGLGQI